MTTGLLTFIFAVIALLVVDNAKGDPGVVCTVVILGVGICIAEVVADYNVRLAQKEEPVRCRVSIHDCIRKAIVSKQEKRGVVGTERAEQCRLRGL